MFKKVILKNCKILSSDVFCLTETWEKSLINTLTDSKFINWEELTNTLIASNVCRLVYYTCDLYREFYHLTKIRIKVFNNVFSLPYTISLILARTRQFIHDKIVMKLRENLRLFGTTSLIGVCISTFEFQFTLLLMTILEVVKQDLFFTWDFSKKDFVKTLDDFIALLILIHMLNVKRCLFNLLRFLKVKNIIRRKPNYKSLRKLKSFLKQYFTTYSLLKTSIDVIFMKPKYRPIVARKPEIKQIFRILIRMLKNNPLLIVDKGKGTSFILEGVVSENHPTYTFLKFDMEEFFEIQDFLIMTNLFDYFVDYNLKDKLRPSVKYKLILIIYNIELIFFVQDFSINQIIRRLLVKKNNIRIIGIIKSKAYQEHFEKDGSLENFF